MSHPDDDRPMLLQTRFAWFFWTQCSGAFNDNLFKNLLVLLVTFNAARYTELAPALVANLAAGLFILPFVLFSGAAGQLADSMDKVRVMRAVKLAEIVIMAVASIGFYAHSLSVLLLALFLMGVHSTVFGPAKYAILPQVLPPHRLLAGNAWVEMGTFVSILLGTLAAGYMTRHGDAPLLLSLSVLLTALVGYGLSRRIPLLGGSARWPRVSLAPGHTRRLLQRTRAQPSVWRSILGISWFWLMGSVLLAQLPAISKDVLRADAQAVTAMLAVFSIAVGAGSMLCERLLHAASRQAPGQPGRGPAGHVQPVLLRWAAAGISAGLLHLWWTQAHWILLDLAFVGVCSGLFIVPLYTQVQRDSPVDETSRAIAVNNILNALFMVAGALAAMVLLSIGLQSLDLLAVVAVFNVVVCVGGWFYPRG